MGKDPEMPDTMRDRPASRPVRSRSGGMGMVVFALLLISAAALWGLHAYNTDTTGPAQRGDLEITIFLLVLAVGAVTVGRKMLAPDAEQVLARDLRPPVVYLRPFDEDSRRLDRLPVGLRSGGRPVMNPTKPATQERRIARALKRIGPFVAVGAPGDRLAPLGAARLYLADSDWQKKVDGLVRGAAAIVLQPETSEGTRWEVTEVARLVDPRRVLIIVPDPARRPLGYARIQALTVALLPVPLPADCRRADAFMFDSDGRPQPLIFGRRAGAALRPFVAQVQRLPIAP